MLHLRVSQINPLIIQASNQNTQTTYADISKLPNESCVLISRCHIKVISRRASSLCQDKLNCERPLGVKWISMSLGRLWELKLICADLNSLRSVFFYGSGWTFLQCPAPLQSRRTGTPAASNSLQPSPKDVPVFQLNLHYSRASQIFDAFVF